jgi:non-ribosomal peptide synthetase component F
MAHEPIPADVASQAIAQMRLSSETTQRLRQVSERHGATWPQFVTAVMAAYVARLSGQPEVVLGFPVTARVGRRARNVPGMMSNALPLRATLSADTSIIDLPGAVSRQGIDPVTGVNATPLDVTENPRQFRFKEVDAAQLPRTLDDFDATPVNADYAIKAGLNPAKDPILKEDGSGVYACLIAVRERDAGKPWVQQLVKAISRRKSGSSIWRVIRGRSSPRSERTGRRRRWRRREPFHYQAFLQCIAARQTLCASPYLHHGLPHGDASRDHLVVEGEVGRLLLGLDDLVRNRITDAPFETRDRPGPDIERQARIGR